MEKVPAELRKALASTPLAQSQWDSLTPIGRRDFISWIESAKQLQTRKSRIERVPSMLASGKRRPCCYAIVPMDLYKTLDAFPKAKAQWKNLTPDERRDFVDWIGSAREAQLHRDRIEKTAIMLMGGKRQPYK